MKFLSFVVFGSRCNRGSAPGRAARPSDFVARVFGIFKTQAQSPARIPEFAAGLAQPGADCWL